MGTSQGQPAPPGQAGAASGSVAAPSAASVSASTASAPTESGPAESGPAASGPTHGRSAAHDASTRQAHSTRPNRQKARGWGVLGTAKLHCRARQVAGWPEGWPGQAHLLRGPQGWRDAVLPNRASGAGRWRLGQVLATWWPTQRCSPHGRGEPRWCGRAARPDHLRRTEDF